MNRIFGLLKITALFMTVNITNSCNNNINPPEPDKIKKEFKIHGTVRIDNYYWLKDINNPKVVEYLKAENEYTQEMLAHTQNLQDKLFNEIISHIQPHEKTVPFKENGYFYYLRYEPQQEQPLYCRIKDDNNASEEIMLDLTVLSLGHPFFEIEEYSISPDNNIIAYSVDTLGRQNFEIRFKNLSDQTDLPDIIKNCSGAPVWTNDGKAVYYTKTDSETLRDYKICKHIIGTNSNNDKDIYTENDEQFDVAVYRSKSDKFIFIESFSSTSNEIRFTETDKNSDAFKLIRKRTENLEYSVENQENNFIILNNYKAKNFKLSKVNISESDLGKWTDIIPETGDSFIEDFDVFENFIVLIERIAGQIKFHVINTKANTEYYIDFGEEVYEAWISDNYEYKSDCFRYGYSSLTTPTSYFDINLFSGEKKLLKQKFTGKDFNPKNYKSKRLYAIAEDGTYIPVSIVYKKGIVLDANNPLLIYGYGAYGISSDAYFIPSMLSLLDRGFIYAIAHVRGGQELGRKWYEQGKLLNKNNSFTDFITCTKYLHEKKYSRPELTFAQGASAGGLLVTAVANKAPQLYAGIIAEVPFVDIVTTMLDKTIPLTTSEYDEWGNPENKKYFDYMLTYSPYDCIKEQEYPAMLLTAGIHDSQVQYWEPAKYTAKLRQYNTSKNPVYLYMNMNAGHGGSSGRFETFKETSLTYAFMLDLVNKFRKNM